MGMLQFDVTHLRAAPLLASFVAVEYFSDAVAGTNVKVSPLSKSDKLTFERVSYANRAAAALFKWSVRVLVAAAASENELTIDQSPPEQPESLEENDVARELVAAFENEQTV